ncbi:hypothetical protein [Ralstonia insidiosa]|uniref:Uncharacterized protein n=1 Tax=Ralstonia insidiosa TaxID=190721 RepID=A0A848PA48_9RALS|nr:hypothetical protein [Ralstonia insidiosa]NMV41504.1 hypothetical protein [Ralstonia insidiosa]
MENKEAVAKDSAIERMMRATSAFIRKLDAVPGWRDARVANLVVAMDLDDMLPERCDRTGPIVLPIDIDREHAVVTRYLELCDLVLSVKTCEYYFRRYPFNGLPVSRHEHLSNACELYFSRVYQFKERLKHLVDAVDALVPQHGLQFGPFIKQFAKEFDSEIRERNQIHHFERFMDLDIERIFLTGLHDLVRPNGGWRDEQRAYYRKVAKEWVQRVRIRGARLDAFLEAVAEALLQGCPFLTNTSAPRVADGEAKLGSAKT